MSYNNFSRPVQPVDQYLPISDEMLTRGAMETYNKAGQLGQKLSAYKSNLFGIQTYGKDAEVLQDYENQFNQQVAELSKGDITSPQALSKFNSLVSNFSNNEDVLGIHARANKYNSDLKEFKDYQKAGKPISEWRQKSIKQANDYYNSGKYFSDERFSGTIKVDPEINKIKLEVLKSLKDEDYTTTDKNGFVHHNFGVSPERVKQALGSMVENDGQIKDYYNDLFDNETQDLNFTDQADNIYTNLYENYSLGATSPNPNTVASSLKNIESLERAKQSSMYPELMKQKYRENWLNSQFDADAQAYGITSKIESKAEDAQLHAANAQYDHNLKQEEIAWQQAKEIEVAKAKGLIPKSFDEGSGQSALDVFRKIKGGQFDSEALTPEDGILFNSDASKNWTPNQVEKTYGLQSKVSGNWIPIETVQDVVDLFGENAKAVYDPETGTTTTTSGKSIIQAFRNEEGRIAVVTSTSSGKNEWKVIDDSQIKSKIKSRLTGKNLETVGQKIEQYDMSPMEKGTGSDTPSETSDIKYTTEEYNSAKQYAIDSLGYQNPSKEVIEKVIQQAKQ